MPIVADVVQRFTDNLGNPYLNATIRFGKPNVDTESNPINVYSDKDKSINYGSSVSTDAFGRPSVNGSAATLFVFEPYSMEVIVNSVVVDSVPYGVGIPDLTTLEVSTLTALKALSVTDGLLVYYAGRGHYQFNASSTATADDVLYVAPDAGTGLWELEYSGALSPAIWGAVGDSVTDDATAFQSAINSSVKEIDGEGKTYVVNSELSVSRGNFKLKNLTIDFSSAPSAATVFKGNNNDIEAAIAMSNNTLQGDVSIDISSTSTLAADDWLYVTSDLVVETITNATQSEYIQIASITDSNTFATYQPVLDGYNTSDNAQVQKVNFIENIEFENVHFIGGGDGSEGGAADQFGVELKRFRNVKFIKCSFTGFDNRAIEFDRCVDCWVDKSIARRANHSGGGVSYGVTIINGTQNVWVDNCRFEDMRHGVSSGGVQGINRNIFINNILALGCTDAAIDCHPPTQNFQVTGGIIQASTIGSDSKDGILLQGIDCDVNGTRILDFGRHAVLIQNEWTETNRKYTYNIKVDATPGVSSATTGVLYQHRAGSLCRGLKIDLTMAESFNSNEVGRGVHLDVQAGGLRNVKISASGDQITNQGVYIEVASGAQIRGFSISDSQLTSASTSASVININATGSCDDGTITGNTTIGGDYGVETVGTNSIACVGNTLVSHTSGPASVAGSNSVTANNVVA